MEAHASRALDAPPACLDGGSPVRGVLPRLAITPEPSPVERRAIELALEQLAQDRPGESAWWRAGLPTPD